MGAEKKRYTSAYRRDAAHLVIDTGRTIAEVAQEIGVAAQLLGRWDATERAQMDDPTGALHLDEPAELERLRVKNSQLRMDRELLKEQRPSSSRRKARARPGVGADPRAEGHLRHHRDVRLAEGLPIRSLQVGSGPGSRSFAAHAAAQQPAGHDQEAPR
jgi:transposase